MLYLPDEFLNCHFFSCKYHLFFLLFLHVLFCLISLSQVPLLPTFILVCVACFFFCLHVSFSLLHVLFSSVLTYFKSNMAHLLEAAPVHSLALVDVIYHLNMCWTYSHIIVHLYIVGVVTYILSVANLHFNCLTYKQVSICFCFNIYVSVLVNVNFFTLYLMIYMCVISFLDFFRCLSLSLVPLIPYLAILEHFLVLPLGASYKSTDPPLGDDPCAFTSLSDETISSWTFALSLS